MEEFFSDNPDQTRTRAERRHNDYKKAIRKKEISHSICLIAEDLYNNLHQYSKNKIHCSCPLCAMKTNNKGKRGGHWAKAYDPPVSEIKKIDGMTEQLKDMEQDS